VGTFPEDVKDYLVYLTRCEAIRQDLQNLAEEVDFVIEMLELKTPETSDSPETLRENAEILTIQRVCLQRLNNVKRHIERLNRDFEAQNKASNIPPSITICLNTQHADSILQP
jgi:hypothetical protein